MSFCMWIDQGRRKLSETDRIMAGQNHQNRGDYDSVLYMILPTHTASKSLGLAVQPGIL